MKATRFTTPPCEVRWAKVTDPDYKYASTQDPRGSYSIQVVLDPTNLSHANFIAELQQEWDRGYEYYCRQEQKKKLVCHEVPWTPLSDNEGNDTGLVAIRPKNKESFVGKDGETVAIDIVVVDAKKQRIRVEIGNGSICRVSFDVSSFYTAGKFGLQLRLKAVQVLSLVEYGADYGFEEEASGYTGEPYEAPAKEHKAAAPKKDEGVLYKQVPPDPEFGFAAKKDEDELPF